MRYAFRGACDDAVQQGFTSMFHALGQQMSQDKPVTGKSSEKDKNRNKEISELTKSVFQGKLFLLRIPIEAT